MDQLLFDFIYNQGSNLAPAAVVFFADYLGWLMLSIALGVVAAQTRLNQQFWRDLLVVSIAGLAAWLLTVLIKIVYPLPRPAEVLVMVEPLVKIVGASFPSGHAALFMAVAYGVDREYFAGWRSALIISALVVGVARIAAGVHWPSDILAGWLLGAGVASIIQVFTGWTRARRRLLV